MALPFQPFSQINFGSGIDQQSSEDQIPDGFVEDLRNADPNPEGYISKRKGYQGYAGNIPVRVLRVEPGTAPFDLCFRLDSSIDLSSIRSTPLVVQGRASAGTVGQDFVADTDTVRYYSAFSSDIRTTINVGANSITFTNDDHQMDSANYIVGAARSDSEVNLSNTHILYDSLTITESNFQTDLTLTNGTSSAFDAFFYFKNKEAVSGSVYVHTATGIPVSETVTITINAGTHALSNFNIAAEVYIDAVTTRQRVIPQTVVVDSTGTVTITIQNVLATTDYVVLLTAIDSSNVLTGSAAAGTSQTVSIENIESEFLFVYCFLEDLITGDKELVFPDSVTVDFTTGIASVVFTNNTASAANFFVYYEYGSILTNELCVDAQVGTYTDTEPQLTLWGLDHAEIYRSTAANRAGWSNHIDTYRGLAENFVVTGLGGNLFRALSRTDGSTDYKIPLLYPNIRERVLTSTTIGPAFIDLLDTTSRTRGYYQFDGGGEGYARVSTITFDSGVGGGTVKYELSTPSLSTTGTPISTTTNLEDRLTVIGAGKDRHNGTFKIVQVTTTASTINVWVENEEVDSSDFDETDSGALAGVFSDQLPLTNTSPFLPEDYIDSDLFDNEDIQAITSSGSIVVIGEILSEFDCGAGLRLVGNRQTSILPLRDIDGNETVENLVRGDMIAVTGYDRLFRINSINPAVTETVDITGDGETAIITGIADTTSMFVGQKLLLAQAGVYTGGITVAGIESDTSISFESIETDTVTGAYLIGKTVEVDEITTFEDTINSTTSVQVPFRWVPIEAPEVTGDLPVKTYRAHFESQDYDNQEFVKSSMVADNLYLTNKVDMVSKFDSLSLYRAGLPRWQAALFLTTDTSGSTISIPSPSTENATGWTGSRFQVSTEDQLGAFQIGDRILSSQHSGITFTITEKIKTPSNAPTNFYFGVDQQISGATAATTLTAVAGAYRYYFRLNMIDANDNIILSAVTGSDDFFIELTTDAAVKIRLVGFPAWDNYDFDRIEVEVYRTKFRTVAPFYKILTKSISFDNYEGYIDIIDTKSDDEFLTSNLDAAITAIKGEDLGINLSHPLRAKYLTTAGNRLILGHLEGDPTIDLKLVTSQTDTALKTLLNTKRFLFRKDNTDDGPTTDMVNRAGFEFRNTASTVTVISQLGQVITFTLSAALGSAPPTGSWVYLFNNVTAKYTELMGWYQIQAGATTTSFSIKIGSGITLSSTTVSEQVNRVVFSSNFLDVPVYLGTDDGNYKQKGGTNGFLLNHLRAFANAINASMRMTDVTLSGQESFQPWLMAKGGGDAASNQVVIYQPKVFSTTAEVLLPTITSSEDLTIFGNDIKRESAETVGAFTATYPSRVIISYPNYPEVFDNPTAILDTESDSAIDVNPADGQEITGIIPFFGDTAFGAALKGGVVVVFKTNSVYLIDLAVKAAGGNPVQRVESQGLGCTAPGSIAVTRDGIMFANESGIFRLNRSLQVEFTGQKLERQWLREVNKEALDIAQGHHYALGRLYKLSVPTSINNENSDVFVYNHTREYKVQGFGSWTRYDNHPATGWCNFAGIDSMFGTTSGRVFSIRRLEEASDYRDDSSAINAYVVLRADSMGTDSLRKKLANVILYYRSPETVDSTNTTVEVAVDLTNEFVELDQFQLRAIGTSQDGLTDVVGSKIKGLRFSSSKRDFVFVQLRVTNDGIDEKMELVRATYIVSGAGEIRKGMPEAKDTL